MFEIHWKKVRICRMVEDDLPDLQLTLGSVIRNEYGIWKVNEALVDDCRRIKALAGFAENTLLETGQVGLEL